MYLTLFLGLLILFLLAMVGFLLTKKQQTDPVLLEWLKTNQKQIYDSNHTVNQSISTQTAQIAERLAQATKVMGELQREAGKFSQVSESMKDLDALLKSPKLRGNMGERVLADLLAQVFAKQVFALQYHFQSGAIVDAIVKTNAGLLPIDSKFPMEQFRSMIAQGTQSAREQAKKEFRKDVRKHIDAIALKYILPQEGTMDFALMYVPSETVYYEIACDDVLLEYARNKRVYPVSPMTMYAHLQTILLSFEGKKIESKAHEVFALLRGVQKEYTKFYETFSVLGKHITNAHNAYTTSLQTLASLERSVHHVEVLQEEKKDALTKELPTV